KFLEENFGKLPEEYQQLVRNIGDRKLGPSYSGFQLLSIAVWLRNEEQYTAIDYWQGTSNLYSYYRSNVLNELIKKRNQLQTDSAATISTLASAVSTLSSTIANNFYYVKLVISNFSQGGLYLGQYGGPDLNVIQPTIMKDTSATYILLVYECTSNDSLDNVLSGKIGKEIINLTNGTTYKNFYGSFIYASITADDYMNIEINIQIGGNPFKF
ncbi:3886_t:CDS:2, partial [Racocetra fulgida]